MWNHACAVSVYGLCTLCAQAQTWDWQLSEPYDYTRVVDVMDIDPDNLSKDETAEIKARGTYLICYVSVGTQEKYREDRDAFPALVVGKTYGDWPNEKFLDIRQLDVLLPLMKARFQRCKDYGFDAIEPDNMDVYDNDSGFALTEADGLRYIRALADLAHSMGLQIGQKNVPDATLHLVDHLDFIITEACYDDGWCDEILPYAAQGKPVYAAEYTDTSVDFDAACEYAKINDISMILKDRDLTSFYKSCP